MRIFLAFLAAAILRAQVPAPAPQNDNAPRASLSGTVVNSVTGEPVKRAQVTILFKKDGTASPGPKTDSSGSFEFSNLRPGRYEVMAQNLEYGMQVASSEVTLQPGEDKRGLQLALTPGGIVSGRIVDDEGAPFRNARVRLLRFFAFHRSVRLIAAAITVSDDRGEFRLFDVPPGKYYLSVRSNKFIPQRRPLLPPDVPTPGPREMYAEVFYPSSPDLNGAARLAVKPGTEISGIEIRLKKVRATPVRGRIIGVGDTPGYQIFLIPHGEGEWAAVENIPATRRLPDGRFEVDVPRPGAYRLAAASFGQPRLWAMRDLVVGSTPIEDADLDLQPGMELSGSVEVEDGGTSPGGSNVQLETTGGQFSALLAPSMAPVRPDGSFRLTGVAPGKWTVHVYGGNGYVKSLRLGNQQMDGDELEISPGAAGPLEIVVGTRRGKVEGSVESDDASEKAFRILGERESGGDVVETGTDSQGHFQFPELIPGKYRLFAIREADRRALQDESARTALESRSAEVTVEEDGTATANLSAIPSDEVKRAADDE